MKKFIAGAVALFMCAAAFVGCNKDGESHTEHDYQYEYIDENTHKVTCSGCNYNDTVSHTFNYESVDGNSHRITCEDCDGVDKTEAHDYDYEYIDTSSHKRTCDTCNTIETVEHDFEYEYIDEDTHITTCTHCVQLNETEAHVYSSETDLTCPCEYVRDWYPLISDDTKEIISAGGYVTDKIGDFSQYVGTDAYRTVSTSSELIEAVMAARYSYTSKWNADTQSVEQTLNSEGTVHVIEITDDIDMGYKKLDAKYQSASGNGSYVENYSRGKDKNIAAFTMSDIFNECGFTKLKIENTNNLLIYSKNGAKLTHCGLSLLSDSNVVIRNLEFDEMWQWEDSASTSTSAVGDYDAFGWAYVKVAHCGYVWIDHCTFGKSYDGQIDYSNPVYNTAGTAFRAPYGATGENGLHISWCKFNAGSDDPDGYLYKMMAKIEEEYQAGGKNYLYYNALRDGGISFEDILYGLAIPQKKGFLCGDSGNGKEDYDYNLSLQISFANCVFKNLEDRIPKLRGGNAYMYNCVVDSTEYMTYRTKLRSQNAAAKVQAVKSNWKCALVSQGIVCGNGGSFKAENCIFKGIETLLKNNDNGGTTEGDKVRPVNAGYQLVNCSYQKTADSAPTTTNFTNSSTSTLKTDNFSWHTPDGEAPFGVNDCELSDLEDIVNHPWYGAGANDVMQERLLNSKYGA